MWSFLTQFSWAKVRDILHIWCAYIVYVVLFGGVKVSVMGFRVPAFYSIAVGSCGFVELSLPTDCANVACNKVVFVWSAWLGCARR